MVEDDVRTILEADPRIDYALVFGSTGRGTAHAGSDLDCAVGLRPGLRLSAFDTGDLIWRLEAAARRDVDLVLLDEAGPALAYRVFRDGRVLFVRDRAALVDRKARAILEYLDFKPIEEVFTRAVLKAAALAGRLAAAAGFRNLVAHRYGALDLARVHQIATSGLTDLLSFCELASGQVPKPPEVDAAVAHTGTRARSCAAGVKKVRR